MICRRYFASGALWKRAIVVNPDECYSNLTAEAERGGDNDCGHCQGHKTVLSGTGRAGSSDLERGREVRLVQQKTAMVDPFSVPI
jgi:hypothetical protein